MAFPHSQRKKNYAFLNRIIVWIGILQAIDCMPLVMRIPRIFTEFNHFLANFGVLLILCCVCVCVRCTQVLNSCCKSMANIQMESYPHNGTPMTNVIVQQIDANNMHLYIKCLNERYTRTNVYLFSK